MDSKLTYDDQLDLLTGFDEQVIEKRFGTDFDSLGGTMNLRALVFAAERRAGSSDDAAYDAAMGLTLKDVKARFAEPEEDVVADEPDTDQGKGGSPVDE